MLADTLGRPLRMLLSAGNVNDITVAPALLEDVEGDCVIADKGYDCQALREIIVDAGMKPVIPSSRSRKVPFPHDPVIYKARNRIERCFNKLKHFRRSAIRFDRRALHFMAFAHLAATMIWMR